MKNKTLLAVALAGHLGFGLPTWAQSQEAPYPGRTVTIVVPYPPGGTTDLIGRTVANQLAETWGRPVVIENRPGAGGNIGAEFVARAPADGYTLLLGPAATHAVNPAVFKNLPYDHVRDFTPVSLLGTVPNVILVGPAVSADTLAGFLAEAKASSPFSFGTPSAGSMSHLIGEMINNVAGIDMQHVAYKGSAPGLVDLMGGHIQAMVDNLPPSVPHIQAGKLRALAITSAQRSPSVPEVPTMQELGYEDFDLEAWFALFGPRGLPQAVVQRLVADIATALEQPKVRTTFAQQGITPAASSSEDLAERVRRDTARFRKVVEDAGIERM